MLPVAQSCTHPFGAQDGFGHALLMHVSANASQLLVIIPTADANVSLRCPESSQVCQGAMRWSVGRLASTTVRDRLAQAATQVVTALQSRVDTPEIHQR